MQIIRSIEPEPRGVYCGAIGLVGPPDAPIRARFNVAIRTAVIDTHTGHAVYGVGGGITWQSQAPAEHAEVLAKTAVLRAIDRDIVHGGHLTFSGSASDLRSASGGVDSVQHSEGVQGGRDVVDPQHPRSVLNRNQGSSNGSDQSIGNAPCGD